MRKNPRLMLVTSALVFLLGATLPAVGCSMFAKKDLVGTWRTHLTGYNAVAGAITDYDQTVTFTQEGTITMDNTLPGDLNHVTGRYETTMSEGKPMIKITWDGGVDKPSQLYYQFQGEKLLTARAPGSLDLSEELNVGNQEPVVYVPLKKAPPQ